jgi:hypothetical protein
MHVLLHSKRAKACKMRLRPENFIGLFGAERKAAHHHGWPVAAHYKIVGGMIRADGEELGSFVEFSEPSLFLSFARLGAHGEPSERTILRWVSQHGLLRAQAYKRFEELADKALDSRRLLLTQDGDHLYSEPVEAMKVEDFRAEVLCAHQLLSLHTNMRTKNMGALRDTIVKAKRHPSSEWPNTPPTEVEKDIRAFVQEHRESIQADMERGLSPSESEIVDKIEALREGAIERLLRNWDSWDRQSLEVFVEEDGQTWEEFVEQDRRSQAKYYRRYRQEVLEEYEGYLEHWRKALTSGWLAPPDVGEDWTDEEIYGLAWSTFRKVVDEHLENVRPGLGESLRINHTPYRAWVCPDLLSAMYHQFYLFITSDKPTRHCENPACGMPLLVTRKDKRHCNATCRSNARNYR